MAQKIRNDFPLILFCLCFLGLLGFVLKNSPIQETKETKQEFTQIQSAIGFTRPFQLKDFWWIGENRWRDPKKFKSFVQARAIGLHYIFKDYCKKNKLKPRHEIFGIYMEISEQGKFENVMPAITSPNNKVLAQQIANYIEKYWRYTRAHGRDKVIVLIRFDVEQQPILEFDVQSK